MKEHLKLYDEKMTKTLNALNHDFSSIRAGRANPGVLDKIQVDYYGVPTAINAMAAVTVSEGRTLVIQPWDKSTLKGIEKAILSSDIGINPTNDGNVIRLVFPQPTEERRRELTRQVAKTAEDSKVAIRSIRRDANETFKKQNKANEISEDDQKDLETKVQKMTDKYIADIDKAVEEKSKEILTV